MKVFTSIFETLILTGCVDARGKRLQDQYCSDKGGVFEYAESESNWGIGYCKDNTRFNYLEVAEQTLRPEFYPE